MLIKKVKFGLKVKQFNFRINYHSKREVKPFEFLLLQLAEQSPFQDMKLIEFLAEYLEIPLADKILLDNFNWLINNRYIEKIDTNLDFTDLRLDDLHITNSGRKVLRENYFPSEERSYEGNYSINPITREYIPKNKLLDKSEEKILEIDFNIDYSTDWVASNLKKFIDLGQQDEIRNIEFIGENDMYIDMTDDIILKDNKLISKQYGIGLPFEDDIKEDFDTNNIDKFNIDKFYSEFEVDKIKNNNSSIKFLKYNETEQYNIIDNQIQIVFSAPNKDEKYDNTKIGSVIFLQDDFPVKNCIYFDDNGNNIFGSNLKIEYYNDYVVLFRYFSINNFNFKIDEFLENIEVKSILTKLLFRTKEEVLKSILDNQSIGLKDKISYFKRIYDYKNQTFNFDGLLDDYLRKNIEQINYEIFLYILDKVPNSFLNKSETIKIVLSRLIPTLQLKELLKLYNKIKIINLLSSYFQNEINVLSEKNPDNKVLEAMKNKFKQKKKKK